MAKRKKNNFKKNYNYYKELTDSGVQRRRGRHVNVLKRKNPDHKYEIYNNVNIENRKRINSVRKKSTWNRIIDISKVSRETLDKPRLLIDNYIENVKKDAYMEVKATVCGKRKEKRRALFKTGKAGKGVAGPTKKIKNINSNVRC